jgi:HEAT repeat protein
VDLLGTHYLRTQPQLRATLATALGRLGDRRWLPAVTRLLADSDSQVRRSAAMGIEALAPALTEDDIPGVIESLQDARDGSVRFALMRGLGRARTETSRAHVREAFEDAGHLSRPHLALALAFDGHPENVPLLLAALDDAREPSQQGAIAVALGLMEAPEAGGALMELLREEGTPRLQGYVSLALGLVNPPDTELPGLLTDLIESTHDPEVARMAIMALGLLGARDRLEALANSLVTQQPGAIDTAARLYGLGLAGDRSNLTALLRVAKDDDNLTYVRAYAFQALADLCDPRAVAPPWKLSRHVDMTHDVGFLFELYQSL